MLECHKITEKLLPDQILNLNTDRFKGYRYKQPSIGNWEFEIVSRSHDLRIPPHWATFSVSYSSSTGTSSTSKYCSLGQLTR